MAGNVALNATIYTRLLPFVVIKIFTIPFLQWGYTPSLPFSFNLHRNWLPVNLFVILWRTLVKVVSKNFWQMFKRCFLFELFALFTCLLPWFGVVSRFYGQPQSKMHSVRNSALNNDVGMCESLYTTRTTPNDKKHWIEKPSSGSEM